MTPSPTALVCEDEDITALHLKKALTSAGYRVVGEAADGEEAVRLAAEMKPDLILMDINMPRLSGVDAARAITAERMAPIIMVTAYSNEETVNAALEAGAAGYLVKPVTREQLLPAIRIAQVRFNMLMEARAEAASLRDMMESRKLIERAKGILMQRLDLAEQDAFEHLQGLARSTRKPLKATAQDIIAADDQFRAAVGIGKK
ncbi:MAG TPA: response regulator [Armatimonadota bacterium]|jgi:response regulator NasT